MRFSYNSDSGIAALLGCSLHTPHRDKIEEATAEVKAGIDPDALPKQDEENMSTTDQPWQEFTKPDQDLSTENYKTDGF